MHICARAAYPLTRGTESVKNNTFIIKLFCRFVKDKIRLIQTEF